MKDCTTFGGITTIDLEREQPACYVLRYRNPELDALYGPSDDDFLSLRYWCREASEDGLSFPECIELVPMSLASRFTLEAARERIRCGAYYAESLKSRPLIDAWSLPQEDVMPDYLEIVYVTEFDPRQRRLLP